MSENARVAPFINKTFYVTAEAGRYPSGGYHSGVDISTGSNDPLYSICDGTVIFAGQQTNSNGDLVGYGNYIIIKDNNSNYAFLFGHMRDPALKRTGDSIQRGEQFGVEGTTGNSTGIHTHVEMENYVANGNRWIYNSQDPNQWNVIYFPATDYMGFSNVYGTSVYYNGIPIDPPQPPTTQIKKTKFKFYLYKKKFDKYRKR